MSQIKAKKSLGQNFLKDQQSLDRIVDAAELSEDENVLEIGPGTGVLTNVLTNVLTSGKVIAVEKDSVLANNLAMNFKFQISNFKSISNDPILNFKNKAAIVEGDILEINLPLLIEKNHFFDYKVVANIPYYISGRIIRLLFETKYSPKLIVLLVQKEVAERICQKPGKLSILAVSVQCFGVPEIIAEVPKESFDPQPKVDSAILKIIPHKENLFVDKQDERSFFSLVKAGFSSPRKTLANNLSNLGKFSKSEIDGILQESGLTLSVRAQELSLDDWQKIHKKIN